MVHTHKRRPQDRVGSGAYGCVCKGTHKDTNQEVAIKRIANVFISKTDALRILREVVAQSSPPLVSHRGGILD